MLETTKKTHLSNNQINFLANNKKPKVNWNVFSNTHII